jgi:hypothetical protein
MICEICEKEIDDGYIYNPNGKYFYEKKSFYICLNCHYKFNKNNN